VRVALPVVARAVVTLCVVALAVGAASCDFFLPKYLDKTITCDPKGTPCPSRMTCIDVEQRGQPVCTFIDCGDGVVVSPETCDDANDNELDMCSACVEAEFKANAVAGLGPGAGKPLDVPFGQPTTLGTDRAGNVYLGTAGTDVVMRFDNNAGLLTTLAGNGSLVSFDPGAAAVPPNAVAAAFAGGIAVDGDGDVYFADLFNGVVRRIDAVTGFATVVVESRPTLEAIGTATQPTATAARVVAITVDGEMTTVLSGEFMANSQDSDPFDGPFLSFSLGGIGFDDAGTLYALGDGMVGGMLLIAPNHGRNRFQILPMANMANCVRVSSIDPQKHIAVAPDGARIFYGANAGDARDPNDPFKPTCPDGAHQCGLLLEIDLVAQPDGTRTGSCRTIAELPAAQIVSNKVIGVASPVVSTTPIDVALRSGPNGESLLAADPTNDVVWTVDVTDKPPPPVALLGSGEVEDFAEEIWTSLALQTDAHVALTETDECADERIPSKGRLQRRNFEVLVPFPDQHVLEEINCDDHILGVAGDGTPGDGHDADDLGGPTHDPLRAHLRAPVAAARGKDGNLYIADHDANAIRMIDKNGVFGTLAIDTPIDGPGGLVVDDSGHLLISDSGKGIIWSVDPATGAATDLGITGLGEPAAMVFVPYEFAKNFATLAPSCVVGLDGIANDPCGMLVVADRTAHVVRGFSLAPIGGFALELAGSGSPGDADSKDGDRGELRFPRGMMIDVPQLDDNGNLKTVSLLVLDDVHRLKRILFGQPTLFPPSIPTTLTTLTAVDGSGVALASSDDGDNKTDLLRGPSGIAFLDATHALIVEQVTGRLRLFDLAAQSMRTVSGLPQGDAVPAKALDAVPMTEPTSLALDSKRGFAYVAEPSRGEIRRFTLANVADPTTWMTDVLKLPPGLALPAPAAISVDEKTGDLYVADSSTHVVARITQDGASGAVIAGRAGQRGFFGDGGRAVDAFLNAPQGVLFTTTAEGKRFLFIADTNNERVRRVDLNVKDPTISTVLGDGSQDSGGVGAPASSFPVFQPRGLAVDRKANLFVTSGSAVRMVQADTFHFGSEPHVADGADAVATVFGGPDDRAFPASVTHCLAALAVPPGQTVGSRVVAVDSCVGIAITLDRGDKKE
jgi:sugar lactone lactonase YvrE